MVYFEKHFISSNPEKLIAFIKETNVTEFGEQTIDKSNFIGALSMLSENEIKHIVIEIKELIQYRHQSKLIAQKAIDGLPVPEECDKVEMAFAIQKLNKINDL